MSTTTHGFQRGQRLIIADPPEHLRRFVGRACSYCSDYGGSGRRVLVRVDNEGIYVLPADALEPQTKVTDMPSLEELRDAFYNPANPQADTSLDAALQRVAELVRARC